MSYFNNIQTQYADSPSIDAFGRSRVSSPETLFNSKQIFDNSPLFFDDQQTSGSGTTSTYSNATASSTLAVSASTAGTRIRQTFQRFNYQPGKSHLVIITGNLKGSGGGAGITRRLGYFDDNNGLFFQDNAGTVQVVRRTSTSGSPVDNTVSQSSWNLDKMDGTGPSGVTIDFTKSQIYVIDFEWLGVGRIRLGFVVAGIIYYCHQFLNANVLTNVYMSTPNLPIRFSIANDGTGAASSIIQICSTVIAEGGSQEVGTVKYFSTAGTFLTATSAGTIYALLGFRLKSAFFGATVIPFSVSLVAQTADIFEWILKLNPTVASTFTYSDITNSALQSATGVTANTVSGGTDLCGGFVYASTTQESNLTRNLRLGASIAGVADQLVICVRPLTAGAHIQGGLIWNELL